MLHDLLETADLEWIQKASTAEDWSEAKDVQDALDVAFLRYRRDPRHKPVAAKMVHAGLSTPLQLGDVVLEGGLAQAARVVREMEFLFPLPTKPDDGYVKGFMDVVFEHEGRTYVLDWKSDELPSYGAEDLEAYVREHYLLQAEIYAVATSRILGVGSARDYHAFGGAIYVFLRGLTEGGAGQWFHRPTWEDIIDTSARLHIGRQE